MAPNCGLGLFAAVAFSASCWADERAYEWPREVLAESSTVEAMDDEAVQAFVKGALDVAYIALVQMSFNASAPAVDNAHMLASKYAECFASLASTEPREWLERGRSSGLPVGEVIFDAAITVCLPVKKE